MNREPEYKNVRPEPDEAVCFASPGGVDLIADVYRAHPETTNGAAVIFVHGGGWSGGKREDFRWHAAQLARDGYATCTVDYRLRDQALWPAAVEDCQEAVRWFRRQAGRLGFDPARLGAMGSSSGGHLVACLGVFNAPGADGTPSRVQCVVDVHGIHDFPAVRDHERIGPSCRKFIGAEFEENPEAWRAASPALHADGESAPMLLTHAPDDPTVPYAESVRMAEALMRAVRPVEFMPTPGSGHGFVYNPEREWTQRVWPVATVWLARHLSVGEKQ